MGKRSNHPTNGRHSSDDDYLYDDQYNEYDPLSDEDDPSFQSGETIQDDYPPATTRRPSRQRSLPRAYPRNRYGYQRPRRLDDEPRRPHRSRKPTHPQDYEYDEYEYEPPYDDRRRPRKRHSIWSGIFVGCLISLLLLVIFVAVLMYLGYSTLNGGGSLTHITGLVSNQTYTKTETQQVSLTQLQGITICDQNGNISIAVDPNATKATITAKKSVQASSQTSADQQLKGITVTARPPATIKTALTCTQVTAVQTPTSTTGTPTASTPTTTQNSSTSTLTVNVTFPQPTNENADLTITLPPAAIEGSSPTLPIAVESKQGDISLSGLSGVLRVHNVNGNVTIKNGVLANGSQIDTGQGNVSFSGYLLLPTTTDSSSTANQTRYVMQAENGDVNVTLPANTNLTLDANTNIGTITSDFKTAISGNGNGDGPVNVHAPLNPSAGTLPPATLVLDVSTGNVYIKKATS